MVSGNHNDKIFNWMDETVLLMTLGDPTRQMCVTFKGGKSACFIVPDFCQGRRQTSVIDKNYVLGLVDGEGSFNVRVNRNRRRVRVELKFSLKLRHQDKKILDELCTFFGCGNVYIQRDKRKNHSLCYRYEVQNNKHITECIIPFFEKNPPKIPSRKRDFMLFKEITEELKKETIDLQRIEQLKKAMHWGLAVYGKTVCAVGTPSNPGKG